jgi:hypothetical protein
VRRYRYRAAYRLTTVDWLVAFAIGTSIGVAVGVFLLLRLFA